MIEHFSGSSMNLYEKDIHSFYTRYVLWEEPIYCENVKNAMEFWKNYELLLGKNEYRNWDTQKECEYIVEWYKAYGLFDFYNEINWDIVEVKTRSKWWTEKEIHESRQFRIYNYWCMHNWFRFMIHQYNKKEKKADVMVINWEDADFEKDFVSKCQQIERFLNQFNIEVKHYDIQKS